MGVAQEGMEVQEEAVRETLSASCESGNDKLGRQFLPAPLPFSSSTHTMLCNNKTFLIIFLKILKYT